MMNRYLILIPALLISLQSNAQKYWQQQADMKIDVKLNDTTHMLEAFETITYTNNSPDTLHFIYLHLWPNAYKHDHTPFAKQQDQNHSTAFYYSKTEDRGYIDGLLFNVNGQNVDFYNTDDVPDIARIDLNSPLMPGGKLTITTPFKVKIPKVFSRLGHTGQAYFITQWFPKPAVYDRKGWHPISLLDQGEFYSEFGTYDVSITLPRNYVVMATGNCMDKSEDAWLDSLSTLPLPADTTYESGYPKSDATTKTIHYHEDNVHDFAWFADKRYIVRKDGIASPGSGNYVTTWIAFLPSHQKQWVKGNNYLKETVTSYGSNVGPYPYKTIKAVEGDMHAGGGMEYPTVTIIDRSAYSQLHTVIVHEGGHNWFYGMLGTMERDHAWMDEGINSFYEQKTVNASKLDSPKKTEKLTDKLTYALLYQHMATHEDQAIEQTSANFTNTNYGLDVYYKTAAGLRWLEQYMGENDFKYGMQDYYNTWHFKHPYSEDLQACLQKHTRKNIDWFFTDMLTTDKKIDYSINKVKKRDDGTYITVRSKNNMNGPAVVDVYNGDSIVIKLVSEPFRKETTLTLAANTQWTKLKIDNAIPDAKSANNTNGRGLGIRLLVGTNRSSVEKLFVLPVLGYNLYDGVQAGVLFHNLTIPENRFRFAIMPMYAFNSKALTGSASVGYMWYPENVFKEVLLQTDAKMYHFDYTYGPIQGYKKIAPSLNIVFNEHNLQSPVRRTLTLKVYSITEDGINVEVLPQNQYRYSLDPATKNYGLLHYAHQNNRTYNPFSYSMEGQIGADFAKVNLTGSARIDYNKPGMGLDVRAFVGKFFAINSDASVASRYYLNTSYTGGSDYLYDGTYVGRNDVYGHAAQQISLQEGGFKVPIHNGAAGASDNWLATLNLTSDQPVRKLPARLFFDAGLIPNPTPSVNNPNETKFMFDGGIEVYVLKNAACIYIPIVMSSDLHNYLSTTYGNKNVFQRSISFYVRLQYLNWLKAPTGVLRAVGLN